MAALMGPSREIGIGMQKNDSLGACMIQMGYAGAPQYGASGNLVTYPYPDQTGIDLSFALDDEAPRPLPSVQGSVGHPILASMGSMAVVTGDGSGKGSIDTFTLKDAAGNLVPAYVVGSSALTMSNVERMDDSANDAQYKPYQAVLVPKSPLSMSTQYTVTFSGKFNGVVHAKTWRFTTTCVTANPDGSCAK